MRCLVNLTKCACKLQYELIDMHIVVVITVRLTDWTEEGTCWELELENQLKARER